MSLSLDWRCMHETWLPHVAKNQHVQPSQPSLLSSDIRENAVALFSTFLTHVIYDLESQKQLKPIPFVGLHNVSMCQARLEAQ